MTLLAFEGFDRATDLGQLLPYSAGSVGSVTLNATARASGRSVKLTNTGDSFSINLGSIANTIYLGFAVKYQANTEGITSGIHFVDPTGIEQCSFFIRKSGNFYLVRSSTIVDSNLCTLPYNKWAYFEAKVTISDSTSSGDLRVYINGEQTYSCAAGLDTKASTSNSNIGAITFDGLNLASGQMLYDDLYVCDGTGSSRNNVLGDSTVKTFSPIGNGNTSNFVGSDGNSTNNYLLVDENSLDTADYTESSVANDIDLYDIDTMTTETTVFGIKVQNFIKKTSQAVKTYCSLLRISGTNYTSATSGCAYDDKVDPHYWIDNPNTGLQWTVGQFNTIEAGLKVLS